MPEPLNPRPFPWNSVFWVLAISAAGFMYRVLVFHRLEQTALLFVGIPVLLAVVLVCAPKAKTTIGGVLKATTLALLLSAPLLGEGFICIVMTAPIFYAVVMAVTWLVLLVRKQMNKPRQAILPCLVLIAFLPMSLEGTRPALSFSRDEQVTARHMVAAFPQEVENALRSSPRLDRKLPPYLRLGFPRPTEAHGEGLEPGSLRTIHFAGGEGHPGDLVLVVTDSTPGHVRFRMVSNETKVTHWLAFKEADVEWHAVGNQTQVTWTLRYRRLLDPAWYFGPWERYGVRLAADYLIQTNATPAGID
jgi:hypothetical protein